MSDIARLPPHSVDAERAVLGGLMLSASSFVKVADWLSESDFYRRDHQIIYRALCALLGASPPKPADAVTMGEWLDAEGLSEETGGIGYVLEIASTTPSAANLVAYAEIVVEKSRLRRAIDIGTAMANAAFDARQPAENVFAKAHHAIGEVFGAPKAGGLVPIKPALRRMFAGIEERYNAGPRLLGLPTPWADINALTKGLRPGVLYIVAGRPSMGKSIVSCQLVGFSASRGERCALFSPEMGQEETLQRMACSIGDIPHEWIETPNRDDANEDVYWSRLTTALGALSTAPLLIDDTPAIRIEQLMARARREHMRDPLKLIVTDHMHDMAVDQRAELRTEYGRIVQGHKTLAKELGIPVVLLAQLNRNVAGRSDKHPVMTDLRESGEIEQKADVILFLHREDYYDKDTHLRGTVEVIPAKGRNLRIDGSILLKNRFDVMRMDDWVGPWPEKPPEPEKATKGRWGSGKDKAIPQ